MNAAAWIGPAIVAAIISALVTGAGWLVSERQAERREIRRRRERMTDMQIALLAEIRASQYRIGGARLEVGELAADPDEAEYTPFIPHQIRPVIFENLVSEIHILPAAVIDPIVIYYQQAAAVSLLAQDMNTQRYDGLSPSRKQAVFQDYLALLRHQDILAQFAIDAIGASLNIQGAAVSARKSGGVQDGAAERNS